jgi:uncharacterized protein
VSPAHAGELDGRLRALSDQRGTQILVVVYPRLPEGAALEDFTVRAAQAWGAGRAKEDDGAVLFVFIADRKTRLEVGYGLEDRVPDAVARRILQEVLRPHLQREDYGGGLQAAVDAIVAAVHGETSALPTPAPERRSSRRGSPGGLLLFVLLMLALAYFDRSRRGRRGWTVTHGGWFSSGGGWSGGGGGWSGGGGSFGGGGFSGGGGSFGGGGASGDW